MASSYVTYTGTGSQTDFTIPFSYLATSDVFAFVNGVSVVFSWINSAAIRIASAPPAGTAIQIQRITQKTSVPVDFTDGSVLLEADLDALARYTLYQAQENSDVSERIPSGVPGNVLGWDASGLNLVNIPAATGTSLVSLAASSGASLVGYQPAGGTASTVQSKLRESVSVKDFGAVGDGVTDDTAAIQAALNSGAKRINARADEKYRITSMLTIDADSITLDFQNAELLMDDATGIKSHMMLGNGTTQRGQIRIRNVTFTRQQGATAGYAIDSNLISNTEISGCRIYGNNEVFRGIRVYRGIVINIFNTYIDNCKDLGIYLEGSGLGAARTVDVSIRETRIEGGTTALSTWDFVEGLFCRDNIFYNTSGPGVSVNASSNANGLFSFKFQENDFDTCGAQGLFIDKVSNVQITDCWFSSNTSDDLQLKELTDAVVVTGNQFYPNASAINCYGNAALISGNLVSGGTTCININSAATKTSISGNFLSNAQYGVNFSTATDTHFSANHISGMSIGTAANNGGSGTVIQSNKGDGSVGVSNYITVAASPFTHTAGRRPEYVSIFGGTVSNVQLGSNSIGFSTNRDVVLAPNQTLTVTYSALPFMVRNLL